jgi:micrococcal nuclease
MELTTNEIILTNCNKKNTPYFSFAGSYLCKCVSVYDGDTITVVFNPFTSTNNIYKFKIRLAGIDTPELRTKDPNEKKRGIMIRDFLREMILDKLIHIDCEGFDKYGRILAYIHILNNTPNDNKYSVENSINQLLITKKYAYAYDGGTKQKFKQLSEISN